MRPARPQRGTRSASSGPARLLAGAGLAALLGGMVAIVIASGGTGDGPVVSPTATVVAPKPKPTPARPAAVRITVTGVGAYDPDGDRSENGGDAPLATDGNPVTAWKSERYRSTFRKTGVGLVVDAGRPVKATRVVVTTETPGYDAEIRVGSSADGPVRLRRGPEDDVAANGVRPQATERPLPDGVDHLHADRTRRRRERDRRHGGRLTVSLTGAIAVAVGLFIGLPALILLAAAAGPIGWIVAAVVLPIAVLAVLLWLGWFRRREDDGPYGGSDTM